MNAAASAYLGMAVFAGFNACAAFREWFQSRDRMRLEISLLFLAMTIEYLCMARPLLLLLPWLTLLGSLLILVKPVLVLRIVHYFRPVHPGVFLWSWAGLGVVAAAVFVMGPPRLVDRGALPAWAVFPLAQYVAVLSFAAVSLFRAAGLVSGGFRHRLRSAGAGACLFACAYVWETWRLLLTDWQSSWGLVLLLLLGSTGFYLAFTTPAWLRKTWQNIEYYRFMHLPHQANLSEAERVHVYLDRLSSAAVRAVGGAAAAVWMWDQKQFRLSPYKESGSVAVQVDPAELVSDDGPIGKAWRLRRTTYIPSLIRSGLHISASSQEAMRDGAMFAVPIATQRRRWGMLLVFLRHGSHFPNDDADLLDLMAGQVALLEELVASRFEFLYSLQHDFASPLTALMLHAELLLRRVGDHEPSIRIIHNRAFQLTYLVDALFDRTVKETDAQKIDLAQFVHRALEGYQIELTAAGMRSESRIPVEPLWAHLAPVQLQRVIDNLLNNATKYASGGGIVQVSVTRHGEWLRVEVADRGPGIPEAERTRVFDWRYRADHALGHARHGSGLGLANVKAIVESHGGRVGVDPEPGGGACFWFEVPAASE